MNRRYRLKLSKKKKKHKPLILVYNLHGQFIVGFFFFPITK